MKPIFSLYKPNKLVESFAIFCNLLLSLSKLEVSLLFISFNYYNKLNYYNFLTFLRNNNISSHALNIKNPYFSKHIVKNVNFLRNTNYVLNLSNMKVRYNVEFLNIFNSYSYSNENIDFLYFKFKEFNSLISYNYLLDFLKTKKQKTFILKIIKVIYLYPRVIIKTINHINIKKC